MRGYRGARCAVTGAKVRGYGGTLMRGYGGKNGLETRMNKRFHLPVTRARVINYLTKSFNAKLEAPMGLTNSKEKFPRAGLETTIKKCHGSWPLTRPGLAVGSGVSFFLTSSVG